MDSGRVNAETLTGRLAAAYAKLDAGDRPRFLAALARELALAARAACGWGAPASDLCRVLLGLHEMVRVVAGRLSGDLSGEPSDDADFIIALVEESLPAGCEVHLAAAFERVCKADFPGTLD